MLLRKKSTNIVTKVSADLNCFTNETKVHKNYETDDP